MWVTYYCFFVCFSVFAKYEHHRKCSVFTVQVEHRLTYLTYHREEKLRSRVCDGAITPKAINKILLPKQLTFISETPTILRMGLRLNLKNAYVIQLTSDISWDTHTGKNKDGRGCPANKWMGPACFKTSAN